MLDEEPTSRRLLVAAGICRGMMAGAYPCSPERLGKVAELLEQCQGEVQELESLARATNMDRPGGNVLAFPRQFRVLDRVPDPETIGDGVA